MDKRQECRLIDQYLPITLDHVTCRPCTRKQYLRNFRVDTTTRYANLSIFQPSVFISSLYSYDLELWRTFGCKLVRICILTCTRPAGGRSDNEDPTTAMIIGSPPLPVQATISSLSRFTPLFYELRGCFKKTLLRITWPPGTVRINLHDRETCKTDPSRKRMCRFLRASISTASSLPRLIGV